MTSRKLRAYCRHYQNVLGMYREELKPYRRIPTWHIEVEFGSARVVACLSDKWIDYGCTQVDQATGRAKITITRKSHETDAAIRETLVHELLHVRTDPASSMMNDAAFEDGLNGIAKAIIKLEDSQFKLALIPQSTAA